MSKTKTNSPSQKTFKDWKDCKVGITGTNGSLGNALVKSFRSKGAHVIGFTHSKIPSGEINSLEKPNEWVNWECGQESTIEDSLRDLDLLVLNHGINPGSGLNTSELNKALEVNALSTWRLIEIYSNIVLTKKNNHWLSEIWVNTSEAEIQPALSPSYEISKRLLGQLISFKRGALTKEQRSILKIRKIILGPFKSQLNPIGIMSADFVAKNIINQSRLNLNIIILSPNPITYLLIPLNELFRSIYFYFLGLSKK